MTDEAFERFVDYVEANLGHSTTYYERKHLKRRFNARMRRLGFDEDDWEGYLAVLDDDPEERRELLDTMAINVTEFFRNPDVWHDLRDVLAGLADRERRVRCWSVPCSDGREPYSLAMLAIDDERIAPESVEILGTDIDPRALEVAETAEYRSGHANDVEAEVTGFDPAFRAYLRETDDGYRVREDVRDLVRFERHDVISGPPKRDRDLVLCRNLLIYIEEQYKASLLENLDEAVADGGYLVIGKTETLPRGFRQRYDVVANQHRIYRKTG